VECDLFFLYIYMKKPPLSKKSHNFIIIIIIIIIIIMLLFCYYYLIFKTKRLNKKPRLTHVDPYLKKTYGLFIELVFGLKCHSRLTSIPINRRHIDLTIKIQLSITWHKLNINLSMHYWTHFKVKKKNSC